MISLVDFQRPIHVAGKALSDECLAFRMNGEQDVPLDMRELVQLDVRECIGYFCQVEDGIALVGDVDLKYENDQASHQTGYLVGVNLRTHANALVAWKISAQACTSMLLLCRLATCRRERKLCREVWREIGDKEYVLWLVVYNEVAPQDTRELDNIRVQLLQWLRGILKDVTVIRSSDFAEHFNPAPRP